MNKKIIDILYGFAAFLFSIVCFVYLIPVHVKSNTSFAVGPKTFPEIAALLIGFAGLALVINRLGSLPDKSVLFKKESYSLNWKSLLRQLIFVIAMVAYIQLIPILGFVLASTLFVFAMLYYFGSRSLLKNALASVVFSVIVYLLFSKLFQVSLASGLLPF